MTLLKQICFLRLLALTFTGCGNELTETQRLVVSQVLAISPSGDTVDLSPFSQASVSRSGFVAVSKVISKSGENIALFDPSGRLIKLVGRPGGGPGEFKAIGSIGFGPGDSLFAHDVQTNLIVVHSPPPALSYVRSFAVEVRGDVKVWPNSILVAGGWSRGTLQPTREIDWSGALVRSFGPPIETTTPELEFRLPIPAGPALIWAAFNQRYVIELMTPDSVVRRLVRDVDWFPDDTSTKSPLPWSERPRARIYALSLDSADVLWVLVRRAAANWRAVGHPTAVPFQPSRPPVSVRLAELFEGVVEALDPSTGAVLGSSVVSGSVLGFAGSRLLYDASEDSSGMVTMRILRLDRRR